MKEIYFALVFSLLVVSSVSAFTIKQTQSNSIIAIPFEKLLCKTDLNHDGRIDIFDRKILLAQLRSNKPNLAADLTGDGRVDIRDFNFLTKLGKRDTSYCWK